MNNNSEIIISRLNESETLSIVTGTKELNNAMRGKNDFDRFSLLYDSYADKVLGFIIAHNYSEHEGEKILVNVFIAVWEDIDAYDDGEKKKLCMMLRIAAKLICNQKQIKYSFKTQNINGLAPDNAEIYFKPGYA